MRPASVRWIAADALVRRQCALGVGRAVWAQHDLRHVLVFQAFRPEIGRAAAAAGTLAVSGFRRDRATWIKPGFLWMMHRSEWGQAEGQEVILGVYVSRAWFEDALRQAELSQRLGETRRSASPPPSIVVQWDPDWSVSGERQPWRAIQVGLKPAAVGQYLSAISACVDLSEEVARAREQRACGGTPVIPDAEVLRIADLATRSRLGIESE